MSFYENIGKSYNESKKKVEKEHEEYQKAREAVPDDKIKSVRTLFKEDYQKQMKLPVEEREIYTDELGVHVIFYITDKEKYKNKKGEFMNIPYIAKGGKLRFKADFPLKHDKEDIYYMRVTVLCDPDDFGYNPEKDIGKILLKKLGVIARGNIALEYKPVDKSYTKKEFMKSFEYIKWHNNNNEKQVDTFEEIDPTEYRIKYTLWQTQILEMKQLK